MIEIIFLIIGIYFLYSVFNKRPDGLPPGEWGLPIIGYLPKKEEHITKFAKRLQEKHGDIFTVKMGQRISVFMTDYQTIKSAFSRPEFSGRPDFFTLRVFRKFQNKGVIASTEDVWHTNRRFSLKVLKDLGLGKSSLSVAVNDEAEILLQEMMKNEGKAAKFDWFLNVAVLNVIQQIATGRRYAIDDPLTINHVSFITEAFKDSGGLLEIFNFQPWLIWAMPNYFKNKFFHLDSTMSRTADFLNYTREIVREHEKTLDKENPRDFIDRYLIEHEEQKGKPDSIYVEDDYFDLVSILADLYIAGSETTSTSIRYYCYYMATHPEIQKKIQKEIDSTVPRDRLPEFGDKEKLPYFEASIHEAQRLTSLAPVGLPHSATHDSMLNDFTIPKGTCLFPCTEICHKNPKYWKRPNEFYPEHFMDDDGKFSMPKEGYLPFIVGRRQCLGENVAKMELVIFLSAILQTFDIIEPENQPISLSCDPSSHHLLNFPISQELVFKKRA